MCRIGAIFLCLSLHFSSQAQMLSRHTTMQDVHSLERILFKVHPAPNAYITTDSLKMGLKDLLNFAGESIPAMEWEKRVRELLIQVGCGHTYMPGGLRAKKSKKPLFLLPFRAWAQDGRAWAINNLDTSGRNPIVPGSELLSLNGADMAVIMERMYLHQPSDGYNRTFGRRIPNKDLSFNYLQAKYFNRDSAQTATWRAPSGELHSGNIGGLTPKQLSGVPAQKADTTLQILYSTKKGEQYFYYRNDRPEIGVLRSTEFRGKGSKLYKKMVQDLNKKNAQYLVIDLRDNTGGSYSSSVNLVRHFATQPIRIKMNRRLFRSWHDQPIMNHPKRLMALLMFDVLSPKRRWIKDGRVHYKFKYKPYKAKYHFNGQVFVLTNGLSFSASSQTSAYLNAFSNAIFIGEETGGGAWANNGMQIPVYKLKGSGIKLMVPQMHLDYQLGPDKGRGIEPDIRVQYHIEEVLSGRDLEWEAVMEQVQSRNQKR